MINKDEYISQIITQQNNFYLSLACAYLINDDDTLEKLKGSHVVLSGKYQFNFDKICEYLNNEESRANASSSFLMMAIRNLIKETFEITLDFAKQNEKYKELKDMNWFQFARMCRNCLSHTQVFVFRDADRKYLPVCWNGSTIDLKSEGNPLPESFGAAQVKELVTEFRNFIKNA